MGYLARKRFYEQHVQAKAAWLSFRGKFGRDGTKGIDYAMVTKRLPSTHEGTHDLCFRMGIRRYGQTGIVWKADEIFEEEIVPHGNKGQKAEWLSVFFLRTTQQAFLVPRGRIENGGIQMVFRMNFRSIVKIS
ncbi:unnamed protein product, partial [Mesorhabditis spiculigera]